MKRIALSIVMMMLATPLLAQDYSYSVKRGETIRIFSWSFFGDTCKTQSLPKIRAVSGASLGKLSSGRGPIKIRKVVDAKLSHCIGKSVDGTVVTYTAGTTKGRDTVRLARQRLSGKEARYDITIDVK